MARRIVSTASSCAPRLRQARAWGRFRAATLFVTDGGDNGCRQIRRTVTTETSSSSSARPAPGSSGCSRMRYGASLEVIGEQIHERVAGRQGSCDLWISDAPQQKTTATSVGQGRVRGIVGGDARRSGTVVRQRNRQPDGYSAASVASGDPADHIAIEALPVLIDAEFACGSAWCRGEPRAQAASVSWTRCPCQRRR